jgi:integrase
MYLDWCDGEYREHPASAKRIRTSFASLIRFFGRSSVASITAGNIEEYKTYRRKSNQVKEITIRHDMHALSGFFRYAIQNHWRRDNPVREVKIPSDKDAVRIHVLTADEEARYFAAVKELAAGANVPAGVGSEGQRAIARRQYGMLHDAARLLLLQGCRPEEVMRARVMDVQGAQWYIPQGKSAAAKRSLVLTPESQRIMQARIFASVDGWLFPSLRGDGHVTTFQRTHDAALEHAGLSFVLYDLRHTFATREAQRDGNAFRLAATLGHGNLKTVMRYVHLTESARAIVPGLQPDENRMKGALKL